MAKVSDKAIKLDIEFRKGGLFAKIDNSFNGEVRYLDHGEEKQIATIKCGDVDATSIQKTAQVKTQAAFEV